MLKFRFMISLLVLCISTCACPLRAQSAETQPALSIMRVALLGDPHVSNDRALQQYVRHFSTVIDQVNAAHVDAVLIAGDLTQNGDPASLATFRELATRIQAPHWSVAGNHDVGQRELPTSKQSITESRVAQFEKMIGPAFFTVDVRHDLHIIGITSSLFGSGLPEEQRQWDFLQRKLVAPASGLTLLLSHYPLYSGAPDEPDGYFTLDPKSRTRLATMLSGTPHLVMLSSHLHRPIDHHSKDIRDIGSPAVSFGLPKATQKVGWTLLTITNDAVANVQIHYLPFDPPPSTQPVTASN